MRRGRLIFHWRCSWDGGGSKGGSRDDGVAVEGCGGQSRGGETTKEEKGEKSFRSDAGVSDVVAMPDSSSIQ